MGEHVFLRRKSIEESLQAFRRYLSCRADLEIVLRSLQGVGLCRDCNLVPLCFGHVRIEVFESFSSEPESEDEDTEQKKLPSPPRAL